MLEQDERYEAVTENVFVLTSCVYVAVTWTCLVVMVKLKRDINQVMLRLIRLLLVHLF